MYHAAGAPLSTIHFGGDEVPVGVWEGSPACRKLAGALDPAALRRYCWSVFYSRLDSILAGRGLTLSGWRRLRYRGKAFNVYVWDNMIGGGNEDLPYRLANAGHKVVLACVSNNYTIWLMSGFSRNRGITGRGSLIWNGLLPLFLMTITGIPPKTGKAIPCRPGYFNGKEKLSPGGRRYILGIEVWLWGEN